MYLLYKQKMGQWPIVILPDTVAGSACQTTKNPVPGLRIYQNSGSGEYYSTPLARDYTAIPACPAMLAADQPTM